MLIFEREIDSDSRLKALILYLLVPFGKNSAEPLAYYHFLVERVVLFIDSPDAFLTARPGLSARQMLLSSAQQRRLGYRYVYDAVVPHTPRTFAVLDTEMVRMRSQKLKIARITLIDARKRVLLNEYCRPRGEIEDYLTPFSGVTEELLAPARSYREVRADLLALLRKKKPTLLGHGLDNDLLALKLQYDSIIDTAALLTPRKVKLAHLAKQILNRTIQDREHDSLEDCLAVLGVFNAVRRAGRGDFSTSASRIVRDVYGIGRSFSDLLQRGNVQIVRFGCISGVPPEKSLVICQNAYDYASARQMLPIQSTVFISQQSGQLHFEYYK